MDWDAIDDLSPDLIATLIELLVHKHLSARRLERLSGRTAADSQQILSELCSLGLGVQNRRRVVQLNPFVQVPIIDWLERRDLV